MFESHSHLSITDAEWKVFMDDLDATFDKFSVPTQERSELVAIVESTKNDIVLPADSASKQMDQDIHG